MVAATVPVSPLVRDARESNASYATDSPHDRANFINVCVDVGEELYGHLEDKLVAYLRSEERLTEADAMVLVREHFGRPETLRGILAGVHAPGGGEVIDAAAGGTSLPRKLTAAAVATAGVLLAASVVRTVLVLVVVLRWADGEPAWHYSLGWLTFVSVNLLAAGALWLILRRWRRKLAAGADVWFARWRAMAIAALFVAFVAPQFLESHVLARATESLVPRAHSEPSELAMSLLQIVGIAAAGLQCLAWLWWAAAGTRAGRPTLWAAAAGAAGWVLYWAVWDVASVVHYFLFRAARTPGAGPTSIGELVHVLYVAAFAAAVLAVFALGHFARSLGRRGMPRLAWNSGTASGGG